MSHPYEIAPAKAFWRAAVAVAGGVDLSQIFVPKFPLGFSDTIATAGSCFAQHISRRLVAAGCNMLDTEPAPSHLTAEVALTFGYKTYSGRYGNIYTTRQMRELLEEVLSDTPISKLCWQFGTGWVDALRPSIEPEGLSSPEEVAAHRREHLAALRAGLPQCSLFIFTIGLTEAWQDRASGRILPVCPGVIAGVFSNETSAFVNFTYSEVLSDLARIRDLLQRLNPAMRLLLTVSPIPLAATASGQHVLTANTRAKSTLCAAAGDFADSFSDVDYFPSFEIVTSPRQCDPCFEPNLRDLRPHVVDQVMSVFLNAYGLRAALTSAQDVKPAESQIEEIDIDATLICEEALLWAFASN